MMPAFDPTTLRTLLAARKRAEPRSLFVCSPAESIRLSLSLIDSTWPLAASPEQRRLHEEAAVPVREKWKLLAAHLRRNRRF